MIGITFPNSSLLHCLTNKATPCTTFTESRQLVNIINQSDIVTDIYGAENHHMDIAARYSLHIGDLEFGLSHFQGTYRIRMGEKRPLAVISIIPS